MLVRLLIKWWSPKTYPLLEPYYAMSLVAALAIAIKDDVGGKIKPFLSSVKIKIRRYISSFLIEAIIISFHFSFADTNIQ